MALDPGAQAFYFKTHCEAKGEMVWKCWVIPDPDLGEALGWEVRRVLDNVAYKYPGGVGQWHRANAATAQDYIERMGAKATLIPNIASFNTKKQVPPEFAKQEWQATTGAVLGLLLGGGRDRKFNEHKKLCSQVLTSLFECLWSRDEIVSMISSCAHMHCMDEVQRLCDQYGTDGPEMPCWHLLYFIEHMESREENDLDIGCPKRFYQRVLR